MLGVLYDIHGNLPALEATLEDARAAGVDRWLLGGDYGTPSPWPNDTLALLRELPDATWIRGNGERWLKEPPTDRPDIAEMLAAFQGDVSPATEDWLFALPEQAELDGILYVHGSPLSDVESFAPQPEEGEERLLAGVRDRTIVFGHSHQQFRRPGPDGTTFVNPGSVGMPLDGDRRAAWATWDGDFAFRRTEYDVESFAPQPEEGEERLLAGVHDRTIVFGHSHQQFRRPGAGGTTLVNPGSVGMPLDGDRRAAWATWDGDFEFRRTEYDVDRAAAAFRDLGEFGEWAAARIEKGSD